MKFNEDVYNFHNELIYGWIVLPSQQQQQQNLLQSLKEIFKYLELPCFVTSKSGTLEEADLGMWRCCCCCCCRCCYCCCCWWWWRGLGMWQANKLVFMWRLHLGDWFTLLFIFTDKLGYNDNGHTEITTKWTKKSLWFLNSSPSHTF